MEWPRRTRGKPQRRHAVRVALISAEPALAGAFRLALGSGAQFELVLTSGDTGCQCQELLAKEPDIIVLDGLADLKSGVLAELRSCLPNCKMVLALPAGSAGLAGQAAGLGILGVIARNAPIEAWIECLTQVQAGGLWLGPRPRLAVVAGRAAPFNETQQRILSLVSAGLTSREIAVTLALSETAVRGRISRLLRQTGAKDRYELALFGLDMPLSLQVVASGKPAVGQRRAVGPAAVDSHRQVRSTSSTAPLLRISQRTAPDPDSASGFLNQGVACLSEGALAAADACFRRALEADPNYALAHFNLGALYDEQGKIAEAIGHYEEALRLDPDFADAHYNLGLLYTQSRAWMRAIRHWRAYLKMDGSSSWAANARHQFQQLRSAMVLAGARPLPERAGARSRYA